MHCAHSVLASRVAETTGTQKVSASTRLGKASMYSQASQTTSGNRSIREEVRHRVDKKWFTRTRILGHTFISVFPRQKILKIRVGADGLRLCFFPGVDTGNMTEAYRINSF